MSVTISGYSDDLISVGGDLNEEFEYRDGHANFVACSDGTVFRVVYANDGVWRITPVFIPPSVVWDKVEAVSADDDNYSDKITLYDLEWVVHGIGVAS